MIPPPATLYLGHRVWLWRVGSQFEASAQGWDDEGPGD